MQDLRTLPPSVQAGEGAKVLRSTRLNVGCGNHILDGYVNLDVVPLPGVNIVHDLAKFPWPFDDNQFQEIRMENVLEHLPDTIKSMEEVWRIAGPGGLVKIRVPYWNCWQAVADPTHRHRFHQSTFDFFDPSKQHNRDRPYYTHARFQIRRIDFWFPLLPIGRGWVRVRNSLAKRLLAALATYLNNIIWALEFDLTALK